MVGARELIERWRCRQLRVALVDHAQGRLAAPERERIDAHLRGCARCRMALTALREVPVRVDRMAVPHHDEAFWLRQRQRIMRAVEEGPEPNRVAAPVAWWRPTVAVATAFLIAVAAAQLWSRSRSISPETAATPAVVESDDALAMLDAAELFGSRAEIVPGWWLDDAFPPPEWAVPGDGAAVPQVSDLSDEELESLNGLIGSESMPS